MKSPEITFLAVIAVAICGAIGSVLRFLVGALAQRTAGDRFPWGTLAINILGSAAIGLVMAIFAARGRLDSLTRLALTTGLLGGFTTYSAFAYETLALLEQRAIVQAVAYVLATVLLGLAACWLATIAIRSLAA